MTKDGLSFKIAQTLILAQCYVSPGSLLEPSSMLIDWVKEYFLYALEEQGLVVKELEE